MESNLYRLINQQEVEVETNFEVWLRDKRTGNRRSVIVWATSFADAEQIVGDGKFTAQYYNIKHEEIVRIDKEYDSDD